jgi:hypothetical protein
MVAEEVLTVKKIIHPGSGNPDPGDKKAPDPDLKYRPHPCRLLLCYVSCFLMRKC